MMQALLTALLLIIPLSTNAGDFRQATWGATPAQIKTQEGTPALEEPNALLYETSLAGMNAVAIFRFENGILTEGQYRILQGHTHPNRHSADYYKLQELLNQKYGSGKIADNWYNNLYRDDKPNHGMAAATNQADLITLWETPVSHIMLKLKGNNYKTEHWLYYFDKESIQEAVTSQNPTDGL